MFSVDPELETLAVKPVATAIVAALTDHHWSGNPYLKQNVTFGVLVNVSVLSANMVAKKTQTNAVVKSLEARALEMGVAVPLTVAADLYLFPGAINYNTQSRVIEVIGSEILGEYLLSASFLN